MDGNDYANAHKEVVIVIDTTSLSVEELIEKRDEMVGKAGICMKLLIADEVAETTFEDLECYEGCIDAIDTELERR